MEDGQTQPNSYTISKKTNVAGTLISVLSIPLFSTTKNIQLVTLPKYLTPKSMTSLGTVSLNAKSFLQENYPVLPERIKVDSYEKLVFTLCKTCPETRNQNECKHADAERSFIGTWTTDEISKAIDKGYKVIRTNEVWHFDKSTDALFKGYIRRFMKIKLESSNYDFKTKEEEASFKARIRIV